MQKTTSGSPSRGTAWRSAIAHKRSMRAFFAAYQTLALVIIDLTHTRRSLTGPVPAISTRGGTPSQAGVTCYGTDGCLPVERTGAGYLIRQTDAGGRGTAHNAPAGHRCLPAERRDGQS
jgi:hypothetical protein